MDKPLVNRVQKSGIITVNLEDYYPEAEIVEFDIKNYLFRELLLKEKDFREEMDKIDWSFYKEKIVLIYCSNDAIVPIWAYQLITVHAEKFAADICFGNLQDFLSRHYSRVLKDIDTTNFQEKRIVIKGCGEKPVPVSAYVDITKVLLPVAKKIMYGEPCSMVPLFKK